MSLTVDNPVISSFSCLLKTHKPGNKVRPVISSVNTTLLLKEWICDQNISDNEVCLTSGLVDIALKQRWLQYEDEIMKQRDGTFIGNGLSSIITEVFLGDLESKMEDKAWLPQVWYRYVDDVFAIIKKGGY
jgi:hypothetical protein